MCRVLIKIFSFFLRKLEDYLDSKLQKTIAKAELVKVPIPTAQKIDIVGNLILLITSITLMICSYLVTSFVITLTR